MREESSNQRASSMEERLFAWGKRSWIAFSKLSQESGGGVTLQLAMRKTRKETRKKPTFSLARHVLASLPTPQ
ncbi:hypothetical protein MPNT_10108 [Candidatus Methylacidithermus pantelleriae]|uniref:Uncharacterized protein n=1 Tax=Candidatus Methylacidithermus pantelleriae TaxID=2744239 RepID=A0A8J2BQH2_9BACT|nr:hypothetical protein MPNT_10108 [Candidatus Methylacidithermus pantelleriae]